MMTKRKIYMALAVLALIATPALAAGLYPNYPLVGGAAMCSSTSTGVNGQVCTTTTPAGPSIVTGLETTAWDTNLASGQSPQTVRLSLSSLNALPVTYGTAVVGAAANAFSPTTTSGGLIILSTGALTAVTISLPPSPIDGQEFKLSSDQTITSGLVVTGTTPATVNNSPTALTTSTTGAFGYKFHYRAADKVWYRLQ
jgi:hypothetical protein